MIMINMSAMEEFRRVTRDLDVLFLQYFYDNRGKEFSSGDIARAFGESRVDGKTGHVNWRWFSMCEDLHARGMLERKVLYTKNGKVYKKLYYVL